MPIKKAAKKALRASTKRYKSNLYLKKRLKNAIKKATEKTINNAYSLIDKAAKKHTIHKNKAAHLKSALIKKIGKTPKKEKAKKPANKNKK